MTLPVVHMLVELTYPQTQDAIDAGALLVLPLGSIEQHGPHLPLGTDSIIATAIARHIAVSRTVVVAPAYQYAAASQPRSGGGRQFPGSLGLPGSLLAPTLTHLLAELMRQGWNDVVLLNAHMENVAPAFESLETLLGPGMTQFTRARAAFINWWDLVGDAELLSITGQASLELHAEHAGILETSLMLAIAPDQVHAATATEGRAVNPRPYDVFPLPADAQWRNGIGTDAAGATAEIGDAVLQLVVNRLSAAIDQEFPR
ncbi:creatininase family protein [Mycolicibacterium baixiangningiae]|uniref:creatininase family protein n=1 Tax=Mycolicibacterium baixiangningiae TaxID=2761578 RepID=UPI0018D1DF4A|nr:creatininase family protein [Mycolicibacterium baixiangningiae]